MSRARHVGGRRRATVLVATMGSACAAQPPTLPGLEATDEGSTGASSSTGAGVVAGSTSTSTTTDGSDGSSTSTTGAALGTTTGSTGDGGSETSSSTGSAFAGDWEGTWEGTCSGLMLATNPWATSISDAGEVLGAAVSVFGDAVLGGEVDAAGVQTGTANLPVLGRCSWDGQLTGDEAVGSWACSGMCMGTWAGARLP